MGSLTGYAPSKQEQLALLAGSASRTALLLAFPASHLDRVTENLAKRNCFNRLACEMTRFLNASASNGTRF
jgi:hypothetical protein